MILRKKLIDLIFKVAHKSNGFDILEGTISKFTPLIKAHKINNKIEQIKKAINILYS